jgi:PAS domain S-box-containing protein
MSRQQFEEISNLLLAYSAGDYHVKGVISEKVDELDMIISAINMLGEELQSSNVSRDFFSGIFNSVSDFVFIVGENGRLIECNKTVSDHFIVKSPVTEMDLADFLVEEEKDLFTRIRKKLETEKKFAAETLLSSTEKEIYGLCTSTILLDRFDKFNGYLVAIKDITEEKEKESLILRTIISTQQREQKRVADDLHDSLGQELAMAQLMIANLSMHKTGDPAFTQLVDTCKEILQGSVKHLREICFDLMPSALVKGGLKRGVDELVSRLRQQNQIGVDFKADDDFPRLEADLEIAAYRVVQEFLNNMIKHANATEVKIFLLRGPENVEVYMEDNGLGFDLSKLANLGENRGVQNIYSKVKAYGGECELQSEPGKGTNLTIRFSITNYDRT